MSLKDIPCHAINSKVLLFPDCLVVDLLSIAIIMLMNHTSNLPLSLDYGNLKRRHFGKFLRKP